MTARQVADRAGFDPALINYHFGSKQGLIQAALDNALAGFVLAMEATRTPGGPLQGPLRHLVREPILTVGEQSHLPRMVIGQVLLDRGPGADEYLKTVGLAYIQTVEQRLEGGTEGERWRWVDNRALAYSLAAIPAFFFLMSPLIARVLGDEAVRQEAVESFADAVVDLLLHGLVARPSPGDDHD